MRRRLYLVLPSAGDAQRLASELTDTGVDLALLRDRASRWGGWSANRQRQAERLRAVGDSLWFLNLLLFFTALSGLLAALYLAHWAWARRPVAGHERRPRRVACAPPRSGRPRRGPGRGRRRSGDRGSRQARGRRRAAGGPPSPGRRRRIPPPALGPRGRVRSLHRRCTHQDGGSPMHKTYLRAGELIGCRLITLDEGTPSCVTSWSAPRLDHPLPGGVPVPTPGPRGTRCWCPPAA
jgi:hypothetical protein